MAEQPASERTTMSRKLTAAMQLSPHTAKADAPAPTANPGLAIIELGAPFTDNAILQREMDLPVCGWSEPGTRVTVEFAGQKKTAETGAEVKWMVHLAPLKASTVSTTIPALTPISPKLFYRPQETFGGNKQTIHWHGNGESYWLMGEAMGRKMVKLLGQGK